MVHLDYKTAPTCKLASLLNMKSVLDQDLSFGRQIPNNLVGSCYRVNDVLIHTTLNMRLRDMLRRYCSTTHQVYSSLVFPFTISFWIVSAATHLKLVT